MLINAKLREAEVLELLVGIEYDMKYQYYFAGRNRDSAYEFNSPNSMYFISIDPSTSEIQGYISFCIDDGSNVAYNFGMVAFEFNSRIFIEDLRQLVNDIFITYNLNKMEWYCFADNPALKLYEHFIKLSNGNKCGYSRQSNKLLDGKLHDTVMFELMKEDYLQSKLYKTFKEKRRK